MWMAFQALKLSDRSRVPCAQTHYGDRKQKAHWRWEAGWPTRLDESVLHLDFHGGYTLALRLPILADCTISRDNLQHGNDRSWCLKTDQLHVG